MRMIDSIDFRGLPRTRMLHFLGIVSRKYNEYDKQKLMQWHLSHELGKIRKLSGSAEKSRELLQSVKDVEHKLKRAASGEPTLLDNRLLKDLMSEMSDIKRKLETKEKSKKKHLAIQSRKPAVDPAVVEESEIGLQSLILENQRRKLSTLEAKYDELSKSSFADATQLSRIKETIERLKQQL